MVHMDLLQNLPTEGEDLSCGWAYHGLRAQAGASRPRTHGGLGFKGLGLGLRV